MTSVSYEYQFRRALRPRHEEQVKKWWRRLRVVLLRAISLDGAMRLVYIYPSRLLLLDVSEYGGL